RGMEGGGVGLVSKAFRDEDMLDAIQLGLERDRARREQDGKLIQLKALFDSLTSREQEVIGFVTAGLMNKQIAAEMGVSVITVKRHRGNAMRQTGAKPLTHLLRI